VPVDPLMELEAIAVDVGLVSEPWVEGCTHTDLVEESRVESGVSGVGRDGIEG
jgi:hypothetical protein